MSNKFFEKLSNKFFPKIVKLFFEKLAIIFWKIVKLHIFSQKLSIQEYPKKSKSNSKLWSKIVKSKLDPFENSQI